jgi:hypothetical protein
VIFLHSRDPDKDTPTALVLKIFADNQLKFFIARYEYSPLFALS